MTTYPCPECSYGLVPVRHVRKSKDRRSSCARALQTCGAEHGKPSILDSVYSTFSPFSVTPVSFMGFLCASSQAAAFSREAICISTPITLCRCVQAHGTAVGLPTDADMGNSEVGHNALGSGQVVDQGTPQADVLRVLAN